MSGYPFSAVTGLDDLRLALLLNAVSPAVGGVLVRGEKGTAKSTVVRALAALLPPVEVVEACRFSCDPATPYAECPDGPHPSGTPAATRPARLVELPVGASEDRLAGSLDLERALTEGVRAYQPGLLAQAHRGVLYVDEVNLLHDHLVDLLLDAAALGTSYVEREGVSVRHAARFLLVGTMNPEEGELRPQLLDRFGLTVEVAATRDPGERAEVVRRRLAYEADPVAFAERFAADDAALAERIARARALLPTVVLPDGALRAVTTVCAAFDVDGLRADLVTAKAAIALAAWEGREEVTVDDVRVAARLALPHRRRRNPFDAPGLDDDALDDALRQAADDDGPRPDDDPDGGTREPGRDTPRTSEDPSATGHASSDVPGQGDRAAAPEAASAPSGTSEDPSATGHPSSDVGHPVGNRTSEDPCPVSHPSSDVGGAVAEAGATYRPLVLRVPGVNPHGGAAGRRSRALGGTGRLTGARVPRGRLESLHLSATLVAAAPHQAARGRRGDGLVLRGTDLREAVREGREGNLVLFVVDASGSMAARQRMSAVKGAVLSLLLDAYQRRDKVGLVTFRGTGAELTLPPTGSVDAAAVRLATLSTGGRTPVAAGLLRAAEVLRVERVRDPGRRPLVVVVTDGRATGSAKNRGTSPVDEARHAAAWLARTGPAVVVVDCESGPVRLGLAAELAAHAGGTAVRLDELSAEALGGVARAVTGVLPRSA